MSGARERKARMSADLLPDVVLPRLATKWLGRPYVYEREVDSTNTRVAQLARDGGVHGTVMVADAQTCGRGRLRRQWHSPAGLNLYFSVLLRPGWKARNAPPLSLAAGVALAEAVEPWTQGPPELKWPNDLLAEGRKLAGILVEAVLDRETVQHVVLGVGLNVNQRQFPTLLAESAASLSLTSGRQLHRGEVLVAVLARLELWLDRLQQQGPQPVLDGWRRYAPWMGQLLKVQNGANELVGTALGLEPHGALRVRDDRGREHSVLSGDAFLVSDQDGTSC